jgi:uncharacterized cupin superfamily protein
VTGEERPAVAEAELVASPAGLGPATPGWFVLNLLDARWEEVDGFGRSAALDSRAAPFEQVGINVHVLEPGEPNCMYHGEEGQEGFLVLSGECIAIVEGEERRLKAWDFLHAPPWTRHVFVGAGDGPCAILMIGARTGDGLEYPVEPKALARGAGVEVATRSGDEAYSHVPEAVSAPYRPGSLPGA